MVAGRFFDITLPPLRDGGAVPVPLGGIRARNSFGASHPLRCRFYQTASRIRRLAPARQRHFGCRKFCLLPIRQAQSRLVRPLKNCLGYDLSAIGHPRLRPGGNQGQSCPVKPLKRWRRTKLRQTKPRSSRRSFQRRRTRPVIVFGTPADQAWSRPVKPLVDDRPDVERTGLEQFEAI